MDDTHLPRAYRRREFNSRGSTSMMALNDEYGSRPPPRRPDMNDHGRQDIRQRNNHQFHPRNNDQHPHEIFRPRFQTGQARFSQNYHQGHHERYGPHHSNFNHPNNQYFDSGPRSPYPPNHSRDYRNGPTPLLHDRQNFRGNHPRVYQTEPRNFRQHTPEYPNWSDRAPDSYERHSKDIVDVLVEVLSDSNNLSDTIHNIGRNNRIPPNVVLRAAGSRRDIFTINEKNQYTILRLDPKLVLCLKHHSANGCSSLNCNDLHICRNHINGQCRSEEPCFLGHELKTNHNNTILSHLHLSCLSDDCLLRVIRNSCKFLFNLEVCHHYNTDKGCKYTRCRKLHICKKFVKDISDCTGCSLNHDVLDRQCLGLLEFHGVPTNETPRDILVQIRSLSELHITSAAKSQGKMSLEKTDPKRNAKTYKSSDIYGDVKIPEICIHSIEQNCQDYQNGCKYLHAKNPFHWQVRCNERWYNIPIFQTKALENAFCEVSRSSANMSGLGKSCTKEIIEVLGTAPWEADFTNMKLRNAGKELTIRRLSTPSASVEDSSNATVFQWYFKDDQDKWIKYGDADSLNRQKMTSKITSNDIEKQFLKNPQSPVSFSNSLYKYTIDFSRMVQVNESTQKAREVRRRPRQPVKNADGNEETKRDQGIQGTNVPSHWDKMDQGRIHQLVDLDSSSAEYREVSERLFSTIPTANIQSIQRLQNPYLWDSFQSRKEYLTQRDGEDHLQVNKHFYGLDPKELDSICQENIDWRRRGTCNMNYGQGTYFSNSAAVALKNSIKDTGGHKYLILAIVIIGNIVEGDPSLTRPPLDCSRNVPYDTAVDDKEAPTFFIKFESNEYYPYYIIELLTSK